MDDLLALALRAGHGAGIRRVEARITAPTKYESLAVRNGAATTLTHSERAGVGVRVLAARGWGFAASDSITPAAVRRTAARAQRLARAASRSTRLALPILEEKGPSNGRYRSKVRIDPFGVPVEEKLSLLLDAERALHVDPAVKSGHASLQVWLEEKWYADSDGARYRSSITQIGAGIDATAIGHGEVQRRSAPTSFGGDYRQAGWEFVRSLDLPALAPSVGKDAVALLSARAPPTGPTTLVLGSDQLALQVHESVGHATELDRILGFEAGYAGTSFLSPSDRGVLQYGSPRMQVVADATEPGGLGTFGWDDEGVPARRTPIVRNGILVGFLSSRETAARVGIDRAGGTARGDGAGRMPLIRMTNVDLLPGDQSFEELLDGVRDGVYMATNRSWSIDDKRLNFQFGTEVGRRIRKGELAELVRNPIYAGMTPQFWRSMDAVGDRSTWHLWGVPNCGKGQPSQTARVGHGAPAARFRRVQVRGG
ncbi:MAG: TldD/PmbA family protein [Thermoplasmata archaeon]|nr:TldD/PmbA family protein [Thermoplasmata archaeon]